MGRILGVVRLGDSTVLGLAEGTRVELKTVRGTVSRKQLTPEEGGCRPGEIPDVLYILVIGGDTP